MDLTPPGLPGQPAQRIASAGTATRAVPGQTCWICLEDGEHPEAGTTRSTDRRPIHCGCGCRGTAGFAHPRCMVAAAEVDGNGDLWCRCPTCKQWYTGEMQLEMAQANSDRVRAFAPAHEERLAANNNLAVALSDQGRFPEAAKLCKPPVVVDLPSSVSPKALFACLKRGTPFTRAPFLSPFPLPPCDAPPFDPNPADPSRRPCHAIAVAILSPQSRHSVAANVARSSPTYLTCPTPSGLPTTRATHARPSHALTHHAHAPNYHHHGQIVKPWRSSAERSGRSTRTR